VAGTGLAAKPQTLVLRLSYTNGHNSEMLSSGISLDLNKPYYIGAAIRATGAGDDAVTFFIKDVSNDCEPLQVVRSRRTSRESVATTARLTLGALAGAAADDSWDGLLDDVRFSRGLLGRDQLFIQNEAMPAGCMGWWRFEPSPGTFRDLSPWKNDLSRPGSTALASLDSPTQALADFCHVLLNSNEFLYTD